MANRGPKPKKIIDTKWSSNLAYAIGLIAADGCLSCDGLLIDLTSKDKEQLENYSKCLGINYKIGRKSSGLRVQFKNRFFYDFLLSIGLTTKKSLTMGMLNIPGKYLFDFLRGCFDGDGCSYSYWDSRWRSSYMFYISFASGSEKFLEWIKSEVYKKLKIKSHISISKKNKVNKNNHYQLKYSKHSAVKLIKEMYKNKPSLTRKRLKINKCLSIMGESEMI